MRTTIYTLAAAALLMPAGLMAQQMAAPPANMPKVGDMAPDFSLTAANAKGIDSTPLKLSSLKGQTVVIAFFPKQRSSGCTKQMETYRDEYDSLFHAGKGVRLLAVSSDPPADLNSWAAEAHFQFTFLSDAAGEAGHEYGTWPAQGNYERRFVFVVAPNGKVTYVSAFNVIDPMAYAALGRAINDAMAMKS
ncbi:MAG TPA: redoxin domain-containing protein [Gemmatimonadales bacterium]|jgi:peroxiredoxin Q/BCP